MKKVKTDSLILHMEVVQSGNQTRLYVYVANKGYNSQSIDFVIPTQCAKQVINDSGLAKHILNYFIKE